jgi:hypothetical protein
MSYTLEQKASTLASIGGVKIANIGNEWYVFSTFNEPTLQSKHIYLEGKNITKFLDSVQTDNATSLTSTVNAHVENLPKEKRKFHEATPWQIWIP